MRLLQWSFRRKPAIQLAINPLRSAQLDPGFRRGGEMNGFHTTPFLFRYAITVSAASSGVIAAESICTSAFSGGS